ncbi:MAG: flagellar motor protein MotB [Candidatus Omnitrophica bacterium]|nr:flagellar motor protein MotB [Candidatus Omnitrophota bacterium]
MMVLLVTGCSTLNKAKKADRLAAELQALQNQHEDLRRQMRMRDEELSRLYDERKRLAEEKQKAVKKVDELEEAKDRLARDLQKQIGDYKAKLTMTERGLVITFLAEILFDSGKAAVKPDAHEVLDKVAEVLATTVNENDVAVEGHTDNDPIKHSGWKSNWELSSARALAVLHYFVDARGLPPARFQANGFGEYQPVASNADPKGRQQNRRVEIVILPKALTKVKTAS